MLVVLGFLLIPTCLKNSLCPFSALNLNITSKEERASVGRSRRHRYNTCRNSGAQALSESHNTYIMPSLKCIRFRCLDNCMASLFGVFLKGDVAAKITDPAKFLNWSWFFWLTPNLQSTVLARPGLHLRYGV